MPGQPYGNVILVHHTATTTGSPSISSLNEQSIYQNRIQESEAEKNMKPSSSLTSTICTYFGKIFHRKNKQPNDQLGNDSASDTANNFQQSAWWSDFKSSVKRRRELRRRRRQKFVWCFRPVGIAADVALERNKDPSLWIKFDKNNQLILKEQLRRIRTVRGTTDCCYIEDKNIDEGKVVVTVMIDEGIAFALYPEMSEPMQYEIQMLPKMTFYQRIQARHDYKKWLKQQRKQQHQQQHFHDPDMI
ncbi:hypothetical protein [Parasitella parasitica]|uniref:Uncharacterized protein n=1 Tax=Parasitella parasitica TaxID=35722 RepID=A0A0B7N5N1_9FUNG|nr:hypothetical protein [Parasitella parasitica]